MCICQLFYGVFPLRALKFVHVSPVHLPSVCGGAGSVGGGAGSLGCGAAIGGAGGCGAWSGRGGAGSICCDAGNVGGGSSGVGSAKKMNDVSSLRFTNKIYMYTPTRFFSQQCSNFFVIILIISFTSATNN